MPNFNTGKGVGSDGVVEVVSVGAGLLVAGLVVAGDGCAGVAGFGLVLVLGGAVDELGRGGVLPEAEDEDVTVVGVGGNSRFQVAGPVMPSEGRPAAC